MNKGNGFGNLKDKVNQSKGSQSKRQMPQTKKFEGEIIDAEIQVKPGDVSKAEVLELVGKGLDMVNSISNTVSTFQQTKQAKERTKQVEMETRSTMENEKEKTARLKMELEKKLELEEQKGKVELEKVQQEMERIRADVQKAEMDKETAMKYLDSLEKTVDILRQNSSMQLQAIQHFYTNQQLPPDQHMTQLNQSLKMLVDLSRDILSLRQQ
jgi:hypothetical protein